MDESRPTIRIAQAELPRMVAEATNALHNDPSLYVRPGVNDFVTISFEPPEQESKRTPNGSPRVVTMAYPTLLERLSTFATWVRMKLGGEGWIEVKTCPPGVLVSVLMAKPEKQSFRPLEATAEAPYLRADGAVVQTPGYDRASRCLYLPNADYPAVPESPSQEDAQGALAALREPFAQFPFRSGPDRDVPIGALLTLLARLAIDGSLPAFCFDASTRGSGKSLIAKTVCMIATGHVMSGGGWPESPEELEKSLGADALAGATLVVFDDVTTPIEGGALNRFLTAGRVAVRVLGKSEKPTVVWRAPIFFTGNNLSIRGDTQRRALISRLEPAEERPEDREDFAIRNLVAWARAERARLVVAGLTILRGYLVAGRPAPLHWGGFEPWAELVASAIRWAGGENLLGARVTARENRDPFRMALLALLDGLPKLVKAYPKLESNGPGNGVMLRPLRATLYPDHQGAFTDEFEGLREALETFAPHKSGRGIDLPLLGRRLGNMRGQWLDGPWGGRRKLESTTGHAGTTWWRVEEAPDEAELAERAAIEAEGMAS